MPTYLVTYQPTTARPATGPQLVVGVYTSSRPLAACVPALRRKVEAALKARQQASAGTANGYFDSLQRVQDFHFNGDAASGYFPIHDRPLRFKKDGEMHAKSKLEWVGERYNVSIVEVKELR